MAKDYITMPDDKGHGYAGGWSESGFDSSIPVWDGRADTLREFKKTVTWWLCSINLEKTKDFNLAARFAMKQKGSAKLRALEFEPTELEYTPAEEVEDPDTNETVTITPAVYDAGIKKILAAWDDMVGRTVTDRKGELRERFYLSMKRNGGESVVAFALRYRTLVAEMRSEGITIDDSEVAWFYKQKMMLTEMQRQMLETSLGSNTESYADCEKESVRLFKRIHQGGIPQPGGHRRKPMSLGNFSRFRGRGPMSGGSSTTSSSWSRRSTATSRPSSVNVTEQDAEYGEEGEHDEEDGHNDALETQAEGEEEDELDGLQALQEEVEVLAAELDDAAQEGCDETELEQIEENLDNAVEALVTLREARSQISALRRDRGFHGPKGGGKAKDGKGKSDGKKSGCHLCGAMDHWMDECPKNRNKGKGSGRGGSGGRFGGSKGSRSSSSTVAPSKSGFRKPKSETNISEANVVDLMPDSSQSFQDVKFPSVGFHAEPEVHEIHVTETLAEALSTSSRSVVAHLDSDKMYQAAVDSACNRSVCGMEWMDSYLSALQFAPQVIQDLVKKVPEEEQFRFGNGGCLGSSERYRIPIKIENSVVMVWLSVVQCGSLGCLLGKDWLEALGAVLDFSGKRMQLKYLFPDRWIRLSKMRVGHFALNLLPVSLSAWPKLSALPWVTTGKSGICEVQCEGRMQLKLQRLKHELSVPSHADVVQHFIPEPLCPEELGPREDAGVPQRSKCSSAAMAADAGKDEGQIAVALERSAAVVGAEAFPEVFTSAPADGVFPGGLEEPGSGHDGAWDVAVASASTSVGALHGDPLERSHQVEVTHGTSRSFHRGRDDQPSNRDDQEAEQGEVEGGSRDGVPSPAASERGREVGTPSATSRTSRRSTPAQRRTPRASSTTSSQYRAYGHHREVEGEVATDGGPDEELSRLGWDSNSTTTEAASEGGPSSSARPSIAASAPAAGSSTAAASSTTTGATPVIGPKAASRSTRTRLAHGRRNRREPDDRVRAEPGRDLGERLPHLLPVGRRDNAVNEVEVNETDTDRGAQGEDGQRLRSGLSTRQSIGRLPMAVFEKLKRGVRQRLRQAAQKGLRDLQSLGTSETEVAEVLDLEDINKHFVEVDGMNEVFIAHLGLGKRGDFTMDEAGNEDVQPAQWLDTWRFGHDRGWLVRAHGARRRRLYVPPELGTTWPKYFPYKAFMGARITEVFNEDGSLREVIEDDFKNPGRRYINEPGYMITTLQVDYNYIEKAYPEVDVTKEFSPPVQELIRTRAADGTYNLPNGDRVYFQRGGNRASGKKPEVENVRVSSYSCEDLSQFGAPDRWTRLESRVKWKNLARHLVNSRLSAANMDVFMMIYHYSEMDDEISDNRLSKAKRRKPLVGEVFTDTEPVVMEARRRGHAAMHPSITLDTGYDLTEKDSQDVAEEVLRWSRPFLTVMAFPCTVWSPLQHLGRNKNLNRQRILRKHRRIQKKLVDWVVHMALKTHELGYYFLIENPQLSAAWKEVPSLKEIFDYPENYGFFKIQVDQCQFGLTGPGGGPHRKRTWFLTNSEELAAELEGHRCQGETACPQHEPVIGGTAVTEAAGHYPLALAKAIVDGAEKQFNKKIREVYEAHEVHAMEAGGDESAEASGAVPDAIPEIDSGSEEEEIAPEPAEDGADIPSMAIRKLVKRIHENTGHRSRFRLARALAIAGAPPSAIRAARELRCEICLEQSSVRTRRPASLPTPKAFNDHIYSDLFALKDQQGTTHWIAHAIDAASRYSSGRVLRSKSAEDVIGFFTEVWFPALGIPRTLTCDMGPEYLSEAFQNMCERRNIVLDHVAVEAPWMNGLAERRGGVLKTIMRSLIHAESCNGHSEMAEALAAALESVNGDVDGSGFSASQMVLGRNPRILGATFKEGVDKQSFLSQHSLLDTNYSFAKQVALRECARVAMVRLHYSQALRRAQLARSRVGSSQHARSFHAGDIVYFFRYQKIKGRTMQLRRWHGPASLIAVEQGTSAIPTSVWIAFRGGVTKVPMEHVRHASTLERLAAQDWEAVLNDVIAGTQEIEDAAERQEEGEQADQADPGAASEPPADPVVLALPETPFVDAVPATPVRRSQQPPVVFAFPFSSPPSLGGSVSHAGTAVPFGSRRSSLQMDAPSEGARVDKPAGPTSSDGTPAEVPHQEGSTTSLPMTTLPSSSTTSPMPAVPEDAEPAPRRLDRAIGAVRRSLSEGAMPDSKRRITEVLSAEAAARRHPLELAVDLAREDVKNAVHFVEDHGSWDGRWNFPSRSTVELFQRLGWQWPPGSSNDVLTTAASGKECNWHRMTDDVRDKFRHAAQEQWSKWEENDAIKVLSLAESRAIYQELERKGELQRVLQPRFVLTDKNSSYRTHDNDLPLKANARIVVPGYLDLANLRGELRRDAPTGSRLAQHVLFTVGSCYPSWKLLGADVRAAFLKGDPYISRELFIKSTDPKRGPSIPIPSGCLAKVLKGVFGLADAPREWYLRLARELHDNEWTRSVLDMAMWSRRDKQHRLSGIIVAHVDDLLFCGDREAQASLMKMGQTLGFGSVEEGSFTWCGKHISKDPDTGEISISMKPYHSQLSPYQIPRERRQNPAEVLTTLEKKKLKGILGSLQWLVAQLRFDLAFGVSALQSEQPTIGTLLRANKLLLEAKRDGDYTMKFRNIDIYKGGILVVTDAALGNVDEDGGTEASPTSRVHSQSCYAVLFADDELIQGRRGKFNVLDFRSHRIPRVCRSSYASETLGAEEGLDAGELARGFMAELRGISVDGKEAYLKITAVPMLGVTDAKDTFDRVTQDTGFGTQKSLAFTLAALRQQLRRPNTSYRWTATTNMWVDAGTKLMDPSQLRSTLLSGEWSVEYNPEFVKQTAKTRKKAEAVEELPGRGEEGRDAALMVHVRRLSESPGWHYVQGIGIHVAHNAKSFRSPAPRFAIREYPYRTTVGEFKQRIGSTWRFLEEKTDLRDLSNPQEQFAERAGRLVTFFMPGSAGNIK